MAERPNKKLDEISAEDAKNFFENAANAFKTTRSQVAERKAASGKTAEPDPVRQKVEDGTVSILSALSKRLSGDSTSTEPVSRRSVAEPEAPKEPVKPERIYRGAKDGSVDRGENFQRKPIVVSDLSKTAEPEEMAEPVSEETKVLPVVSAPADPTPVVEEPKPFQVNITEDALAKEAEETEKVARKPQSRRKAKYLRRRQEEEAMAEFEALGKPEPVEEVAETAVEEEEEAGIPIAAVSAFRGISFDSAYEDDYEGEDITFEDDDYDEDDELTPDEMNEYIAFNALEAALGRHADVYGDPRKHRKNRYHDYGFGMGITFDGPSDYEDDYDEED